MRLYFIIYLNLEFIYGLRFIQIWNFFCVLIAISFSFFWNFKNFKDFPYFVIYKLAHIKLKQSTN